MIRVASPRSIPQPRRLFQVVSPRPKVNSVRLLSGLRQRVIMLSSQLPFLGSPPSQTTLFTYLAKPIHSPMIADPDHSVPLRHALLRCERSSSGIVHAAVRDDRRWSPLDYVDRNLECS